MLGLARIELDGFLKAHGIYQEYTVEDFEQEQQALIIADTGPVNYLIQIGHIELLPRILQKVALPVAVQVDLSDPLAPPPVRRWIAAPPAWLEIHHTSGLPEVSGLDEGETAAISLAESSRTCL